MRPLAILILSDDRPGHYHLAEGVAAAIARRRPIAVTKLSISERRLTRGRVGAALLRVGVSPSRVLALGYGLSLHGLPRPDVVISAGGDTLNANVAVARHFAVPNIFCGTLRRLPPEAFSLVVSSYARHRDWPRHLVALKPNGMDPDALAKERASRWQPGQPPHLAGLLFGGDSGLFHYTDAEWQRLVAFLSESYATHGTRWIASTSRRSPTHLAESLVALAATANSPIATLIDFRTAGPGTLATVFARAEAILCTEDSSTMLSEAVCARLPVVGVAPLDHAFKVDEREYRHFMLREGWCRFVPLAALTPQSFVAALAQVRPLTENHLDRLATALQSRLPALFG
ncbi:MAG: ELM1/GtrOC1 family putative glycosyltransferase [Hyphomicrobiaceae bacterium]